MLKRISLYVLVIFLTSNIALACGENTYTAQSPTAGSITNGSVEGDLTVFAASSLTEAFNELKAKFEEDYPDVTVAYSFAGTATLRTQLEQGARADVFASANKSHMEQAIHAGLIDGGASTFATNRLVVIAPSDSKKVTQLTDLASEDVKLVLALPDVPVGGYSHDFIAKLDASGEYKTGFGDLVLSNLVSEESNVRQVVAKVLLGEADAGIVYSTDVTGETAGQITVIQIPDEFNVFASYPIAKLKSSRNPGAAEAFIEFVLSQKGQGILASYGFGNVPLE